MQASKHDFIKVFQTFLKPATKARPSNTKSPI
jgi:hypothetical protein